MIFDSQRIFEGQTQQYGSGVATAGSSKAAGLDETTEALKVTNKSLVKTTATIALETPVETSLVDYEGQPSTKPNFYKILNDECAQYPTIFVSIGLMVQRAIGNGYVEQEEDEQMID